MRNRDCKVVQDLLPNYIENLTSEETNKYIEEHLTECEECRNILESMQCEIELPKNNVDNKEVKYLKKFSNKMKVLKLIILVILLYFVILIGRNMYLITSLSKKADEYCKATNIHMVTYSYDEEAYNSREIFQNGDRIKVVYTFLRNGEVKKQQIYQDKIDNEYFVKIYDESKDGKKLDTTVEGPLASFGPYNTIYIKNIWHLIKNSIGTTITNSVFNGKECYYFNNYDVDDNTFPNGMYIDKETGLLLNSISCKYESEDGSFSYSPAATYRYEFNTVTEQDFIEPDMSEYTKENFVR